MEGSHVCVTATLTEQYQVKNRVVTGPLIQVQDGQAVHEKE